MASFAIAVDAWDNCSDHSRSSSDSSSGDSPCFCSVLLIGFLSLSKGIGCCGRSSAWYVSSSLRVDGHRCHHMLTLMCCHQSHGFLCPRKPPFRRKVVFFKNTYKTSARPFPVDECHEFVKSIFFDGHTLPSLYLTIAPCILVQTSAQQRGIIQALSKQTWSCKRIHNGKKIQCTGCCKNGSGNRQ